MQHSRRRTSVGLAIAGLLAMLVSILPSGTAQAAPFVPPVQWTQVDATADEGRIVTSPNGDVTIGCSNSQDLTTYNSSGVVVRQISRTSMIDGVTNCIRKIAADKNSTIYGVPEGSTFGPNLLAYAGNALKWKYPLQCDNNQTGQYVVGGDGNIYATTRLSDGVHLIGLKPELDAGQSTPTKMLDIKVANDCSMMLYAYKDGLVLHGQSSGGAKYYSYGGKYLAQTNGDVWYEKLNAEGRLFSSVYVNGGGITTQSVKMFNPATGQIAWTTPVSTPGANTNGAWLTALPGGGVMALAYEQKMLSGGVPATPTEWVYTLTTLNANGVKVRAFTFPQQDAQGNAYDMRPTIVADNSGKVAVVRNIRERTTVSWPYSVPAVEVGVIDVTTGAVTYGQTMRGNADANNGPLYGYSFFDFGGTNTNTLFVRASCSGSCSSNVKKLYPFTVSGLSMDYPRGAVLAANTTAQPAPVSYVDLGDSYSSGQGAGTYDSGTVTSTNKCYKSLDAYGRVSSRDPYSALSLTNFAACGGSITSDIKTTWTYSGVPPQDTALSSTDTKVVTISIGGNDIGFVNVITTCADPTKDCDSAFNAANALLGAIFDNKLQTAYLDILQRAPLAQVYVLGYPPLLTSGSSGCLVGNNGGSLPFYSADRVQKAVTLSGSLNTSIKNNVDTIRSLGANYQRLHFVDATVAGSPFIGHDVCSATPYVNGLILTPGDSSESFHPNVPGQAAYAALVKAAMTP